MGSEEELHATWSGLPQPIYFPVIKEENKYDVQILEHSSNSVGDEINDLCSPSVINLDDSDDEVVENDTESKSVSSKFQQQYDTIDLTIDDDDDDDDDHNSQNKGSCGNEVFSSSRITQDNLDTEAEVCDSSCVIKPSFMCQSCNKCYISQCSLYLTNLHGEMNFLCTICMTLHKNESMFCEHLKSHENRYITCQLCKEKSAKLLCSVCGCCFDNEERYKHHQKKHSQQTQENDQLKCQVCKRNFVSKTLLEIHERLHTEELFKCNSCGGQFWTQQILVEHQEVCSTLNTSSLFKCNLCKKNFHSQGVMTEHMRQCIGTKSQFYYCEMCPDLFLYASNLTLHILVHLNSKSVRLLDCDCCDMKFFSTSGLAAHKYCTGKVAYSCSPCNLQFLLESVFVSHLRGFHSVKNVMSCNSNKQSNIIVEKLGTGDEEIDSNVPFQVKSHNTTQNSELQAKKLVSDLSLSSSLTLSLLKNPVPDTLCLQKDESQSGEKSLGTPKRISVDVSCTDESSPAKVCKTSSQNSNCEQNNTTKNMFPKVSIISGNNAPPSYSGSEKPGNYKNSNFPRISPIPESSQIQSAPQELHVIISPANKINSKTYPRILPKNNVANVQPRRRTVEESCLEENSNVQKKQSSGTATVKPSLSFEVQSRTDDLTKAESHSIHTQTDSSSGVFQKVIFESNQLSQNTNPSLTISSNNGFNDTLINQYFLIGSSPPLQGTSVASPGVLENTTFSSSQSVPLELQSAIVLNNQANQGSAVSFINLQNDHANTQATPVALQAVNVAIPQSNQVVLPTGDIGKMVSARNKKIAGCESKQVKISLPGTPQQTFKVKANSIIQAKLVRVSPTALISQSTSKIHLLATETSSNTLQALPIAAVQALPVNNSPGIVMMPVTTDVSQIQAMSVTTRRNNVSGPIIFKVCREPSNTKLQSGLQETFIEIEKAVPGMSGSGQLKNKCDTKVPKQVGVQPGIVSQQLQSCLLPTVATSYLLCEFCSNYFTNDFNYRIHKLSCIKAPKT